MSPAAQWLAWVLGLEMGLEDDPRVLREVLGRQSE